MRRNIYDFDKTIFHGDSTVRFSCYCARKYPRAAFDMFFSIWWLAAVKLQLVSKTRAKERFYRFLSYVPDVRNEVQAFWAVNSHRIKRWYLESLPCNDLVISASPEFLLMPICQSLRVQLIASRVDPHTGRTEGLNCHGQEKVTRLFEAFPETQIHVFCSDSRSDGPLAQLAEHAWIIRGNQRTHW